VTTCANCGHESGEAFKFCPECGAPAAAATAPREVRKVVTIVFCDLTGSTALGDRTDPETLRTTMRGYFEEMRTILERHGGTVEKFIGDAVMAVFGVPVSREDDALRAVRAAWEMRSAVATLGLGARIGVNTGEVVAGDGDSLVTGDTVNIAARFEQAAETGQVLVGEVTHRLVRDAVTAEQIEVTAKGKPQPLTAFKLLDVDLAAAAIARKLDTPLVGRLGELRQINQAFERAVSENRCHLFTLLGPAGVGKSRLTSEFLATVDATVVQGRCLDYGEGITFWPVISVMKQLGARAEDTLAHIATGGLSQHELFWDVRAQLEAVAAERPLVVLFDDVQWGEPTFLDLLDHIADLSRGAPILLLCLARPDLLDLRPGWGGGKLNATTTLLEPLSIAECEELIDVHGDGIGTATRKRILQAADGNPLFVEEMVALARENNDVSVPSSVHALLQARLDQLGVAERDVIERGSVEGQIFHRGAVRELSPGRDVEEQLDGLVRKDLIHPERTTFVGDHAFRFRHLLIRDAAYEALPKETRADLHERFATWLAAHGKELVELDEVLGHHLEQAARYRRELGQPDVELERQAAIPLAAAGDRAMARDDLPAARNLLGRALALLPARDPGRAPVILQHVSSLLEAGSFEEASLLIAELEDDPHPAVQMNGAVARLELRMATDPAGTVGEAQHITEKALEAFGAAGDEAGLVRTLMLVFWTEWLKSCAQPALAALERAIELARQCGEHSTASRATAYMLGPLVFGPFSPGEIRERIGPLRARGGVMAEQTAMMCEAHLLRLDGRFDEALELYWKGDALLGDLGLDLIRVVLQGWQAEIDNLRGRHADALATLTAVDGALEALGESSYRSTIMITISQTLYALGEREEAERVAIAGEELGAAEDVVNFALGRAVRASIAADEGRTAEAERLAAEALHYALLTDFPSMHAVAYKAVAHVARRAGRREDARAALERALELFESLGNAVESDRTRELLVQL
jgi:class 3 adenylate cyclase/tetratricopeptide (TPR) repeat protein